MKFSGFNTTTKIGIGTNSPARTLDVQGPAGNDDVIAIRHASGGSSWLKLGFWNGTTERASIRTQDDASHVSIFCSTTERLRIMSDGNVGIGTTAPSRLFDVNGTSYFRDDIYFGNTVLNPASGFNTQIGMGWDKSTGQFQIAASSTTALQVGRITTAGVIQQWRYAGTVVASLESSGQVRSLGGALSAPSFSFTNDTTTGMSRPTTGAINFVTAGTERVRIAADGKVGIGGTPTVAQLDILSSVSGNYLYMDDGANCLWKISSTTTSGIIQTQATGWSSWKPMDLRANYFQFKPNNSEIMRILSTGVGIGTTVPSGLLDLYEPASGDNKLRFHSSATGTGTSNGSRIGLNGTELFINNLESSTIKIYTQSTATNGITIASDGKVGIGSTTPLDKLHVQGNILQLDGSPEYHFGTISASHLNWRVACQEVVSQGFEIASGTASAGTSAPSDTYTNRFVIKGATGQIQFNSYGGGTHTGTSAYKLSVDSSGNIIETSIGSGAVDGAGTANYVAKWTDGDTIGNSIIYDSGSSIGIGTNAPSAAKLDIRVTSASLIDAGATVNIEEDAAWTQGLAFYLNNSDVYNADYASACIGVANSGSNIIITSGARVVNNPAASNGYKTLNSTAPSVYRQLTGAHIFYGDTGKTANTLYTPTERMRIADDGNVGIGTTAPSKKLHLYGSGSVGMRVQSTSLTARDYDIYTDGDEIYIEGVGGSSGSFQTGENGTFGFKLDLGAPANSFYLNGSGNVGIGTASPEYPLHISNADSAIYLVGSTQGRIILQDTGATSNSQAFDIVSKEDKLHFRRLNDSRGSVQATVMVLSGDKVGIGTTSPAYDLQVAGNIDATRLYVNAGGNATDPIIRVQSDTNTGIFFPAGDTIAWTTGGSERMRIDAAGKVGIGTDSPILLLHLYQAAGANIQFTNATTGRYFRIGEGVGANDKFSFRGNSYRSTDTLTIDFTNNRVGVANISPGYTLDVNGTFKVESDATFDGSVYVRNANNNAILLGKGTRWGYSSGYKAIQIGDASGTYTVCIGYDPAGNANGSFTGDGGELLFRNDMTFVTPNAADNAWHKCLHFKDGNVTVGSAATPAYKLDVQGTFRTTGILYANSTSFFTGATSHTANINMASGTPYITFYGDSSSNHAIGSRNASGNAADDLRINTYGALYINLDSNNNNTSGADFGISRHGGTGTISDWLVTLYGETGQFKLHTYGSGTHTGTATYKLSVDSSGNFIETAIGAGAVDGAGTANYVAKWTDGDTIGNSTISDNGSTVTVASDFHVYKVGSDKKLWLSEGTSGSGLTNVQLSSNGVSYLKGGSVGIGTTAPSAPLHVYGTSANVKLSVQNSGGVTWSLNSTSGNTLNIDDAAYNKFRILSGAGGAIVLHPDGTGETYILGGSVAIGHSNPSYKLDVSGTFRATGQAYLNGGLRVGGANGNFAGERLFNMPAFANGVANQKIDLYWTGAFWGYLEIEITGSYSNQNMAGVLTKSFALGLNASNAIYTNESWYSNVGGVTNNNFAISGVTWDSTNSRYRIQIVHRVSTGNGMTLKMKCLGTTTSHVDTFMSGTTVSAVYTTDTTAFALPVVQLAAPGDNAWVDGYLGIGTATPAARLHVHNTSSGSAWLKIGNATRADGMLIGCDSNELQQIYVNGANPLTFWTNDTERMRIISDGKVGIGTTAPARLLHVYGANDVARFQGAGSNYIDIDGSGTQLSCTTNLSFRAALSGNAMMTIKTDGKVGIGTTAPATPLHVRKVGDPTSSGNRNTIEEVLTLDATGYYPYNGYGVGISFKGEDYGNTAIREYAKIQSVMTDHSTQTPAGDPSFRAALTFWTNTGGASGTLATEKVRIAADGKVGIGTNAPAQLLHVHKASGDAAAKISCSGHARLILATTGTTDHASVDFGDSGGDTRGRILYLNNGDAMKFETNGAERMRILSDGKVGLGGRTAPSTTLVIQGIFDGSATPSVSAPSNNTANKGIEIIREANDNSWGIGYTYGIDFAATSSVNSTNQYKVAAIYGAVESVPYYVAGKLGFYTTTGGNGALLLERMTIKASGSVGIGTTAPVQKLDVSGNINITGANTNTGFDRYFKMYGNSDPATNTNRWAGIGLYNNGGNNVNELAFFTGAGDGARTEKVRINNQGNVGIGTTAPATRLALYGSGAGNFITFNQTAANWHSGLDFQENGTQKATIGYKGSTFGGSPPENNSLNIESNATAGQIRFKTNSTLAVLINESGTLNVGSPNTSSSILSAYEATDHHNGANKPSSTINVGAWAQSTNEGPTIDFNIRWAGGYEATNTTTGWIGGRIGSVYDTSSSNGGALVFYTNHGASASGGPNSSQVTEKVRIRPDGNVGIGTASPGEKLTVWNSNISLGKRQNSVTSYVGKGTGASGQTFGSNSNWIAFASDGTDDWISFGTHESGVGGGERVRIAPSGNVGIGITNPAYKLEVTGSATADWISKIHNTATTSTPSGLIVKTDYNSATATGGYLLGLLAGTDYRLVVQNDGNVGIGTITPGYLLDVRGTVFVNGATYIAADTRIRGKLSRDGGPVSAGTETWFIRLSASNTVIAALTNSAGGALATGGCYRFTAHVSGTGTDQSARAVFWNQNGTWYVNKTSQYSGSSNQPEFLVSSSVPSIKTSHSSQYLIETLCERIILDEAANGTDNTREYYGADGFMSSITSTEVLSYNVGTTTSRTVYHSGNFTPGNYLPLAGGTMTGTLTTSSSIVQSGNGSTIDLGTADTGNGSPSIRFIGSNSTYNWRLRQNDNNGGDFTIKRSTAGGGTTFESVPTLQFLSDHTAIFRGDVKAGNGTLNTAMTPKFAVLDTKTVTNTTGDYYDNHVIIADLQAASSGNNYNDGRQMGLGFACSTASGGNPLTIASIRGVKVGTGNNHQIGELSFCTSGTPYWGMHERMRITYTGNVGIGTDAPKGKLDVRDAGTLPSIGTAGTGLNVLRTDGLVGLSIGFVTATNGSYMQSQNLTNTTPYDLLLNPNGGNVGIGLTAPRNPLEVDLNQSNGTLVGNSAAHFGGQHHTSGQIMGLTLGYREANDSYRKVGIVAAGLGDNAARQDFHILVNTTNNQASCTLADAKLSIYGLTGYIQVHNKFGIGISPGAFHLNVNGAVYSSGSVIIANNAPYFGAKNSAGAYVPLMYFNSSNQMTLGSGTLATNGYPIRNIAKYITFEPAGTLGAAVETMRITNGSFAGVGSVGIGTASPGSMLEIQSSVITEPVFTVNSNYAGVQAGQVVFRHGRAANALSNNDSLGDIIFQGFDSAGGLQNFGSINAIAADVTAGSANGVIYFTTFVDGTSAERMRIHSNGNVGIGNAAPSADTGVAKFLQIGSSAVASSGLVLEDNTGQWEMHNDTHLTFLYDGTERMLIGANGTVNLRGATNLGHISQYENSVLCGFIGSGSSLSGGTNTDYTVRSVRHLDFLTNNTTTIRMRVQSDGNVGIGTETAGYKLQVQGDILASGAIMGNSKSFVIDHPTKPSHKLQYGALEGPEFGVYHRGRVQSDTIVMPDYWSGLVRDGTITVQLTPNGSFQHLYVVSTSLTEIKIGAADGETIDCYYTIYGERADLDPLVVEKIV